MRLKREEGAAVEATEPRSWIHRKKSGALVFVGPLKGLDTEQERVLELGQIKNGP